MANQDLLSLIRRLMPILEAGAAQKRASGQECSALDADLAQLRKELGRTQLTAPPGVAPEDTVTLLGERADGSREVLGTVARSPHSKLQGLVQDQFGPMDEDDEGGDAEDAFAIGEQLLNRLAKEKASYENSVSIARELVTARYGAFVEAAESVAADVFYICKSLLRWMAVAHPSKFIQA